MMNIIDELVKDTLRTDMPDFRVGDTVKVYQRIKEGAKERLQVFEGIVIAKKGGGISESFCVRKISYGEGVEKVFPLHSPAIGKIEISSRGKVRRAKLYYLRSSNSLMNKIERKNAVKKEKEPKIVNEN
jgi:large subunit ribosomal protein L19